ncbi:polysaccharide pyruvyl transferase family protein [Qaidamihabitans albus]|uniref:polysaccharide pyruvyl transferase family protein n=1 Tax=Qaidamihabitans albus TaxID=2795733 RepID=UPI0018F210DC|nr:polysaccharide pyruvyl transferase family protein [Qaidamihabitans albus]
MTARARPRQVGLFGLLGSGNLGNDGSFEAVLAFLRTEHPDARLDCLCSGPERVRARYGLAASPMNWYDAEYQTATGPRSIALKLLGKIVDGARTAAWVRRHDVVIVPGMGVLEATLPLRPWGFPYSLLLLCVAGRLFGTKVALVSAGADVITARCTRSLITRAASLVTYRSYRDELSRDAMRRMGVDVRNDEVYPDLAFALPAPAGAPPGGGTVGVGVMAYRGGNDDRAGAAEIHAAYVGKMKRFLGRLIAAGRPVRLFIGDESDEAVVDEILADTDSDLVAAAPVSTLPELLLAMSTVDTVVATRYHNVLCALKLGKPTLSVGYAAKNDALMAEMGLGEFCQSIRSLDVDRLLDRFAVLESRSAEVRRTLAERNEAARQRLERQFKDLSAAIFPATARQETR